MSQRYAEIAAAARRILSRPEVPRELTQWSCPQQDALRAAGIPTRSDADKGMKLARLLGGE